jgi:hypothetical protein
MSKPLCVLVLTSALLATGTRRADAVGEGERQLAGTLGFAITRDGATRPGVQGAVEGALGISDSWAAHAALDSSIHPGTDVQPRRVFTALTLGFTYAFDVLRFVPFLDLGLTVADVRASGRDARQKLGPQAGIGVEYLLSRHWTLAGLGRVEYLGLRLAGDTEPQPWRLVAGVRLGRVF